MTISDGHEIANFLQQPSNMKLKKTSQSNENHYIIDMKTGEGRYMIIIDDQDTLVTHGEQPLPGYAHNYDIKGPNKLVEAIKSYEDKWESVDKNTDTLESGDLYKFCPK